MSFLLDSNILSEAVKTRPNLGVIRRLSETPHDQLFTSALCLAEVRDWTRGSRNPGTSWTQVEFLLTHVKVLPFERSDVANAGDLTHDMKAAGFPMGAIDCFVAACALRHGLSVVSADSDFLRVPGLRVENWFNHGPGRARR